MFYPSPPGLWCESFINSLTIREHLSPQNEWIPLYDCVNYFISALPFALHEGHRKDIKRKLPTLFDLVAESLEKNLLRGRALTFAREIKDREAEILQAWEIGEQKIAARQQES